MEDRKLTEKESLEVIASMIARTKERYVGDGNILLMWGYLTIAVTATVWILLAYTHNPAWNWLWFLIWVAGGIATPIMAKKERSERGAKSYSDKITFRLWSVVGYSAIISTCCCLGFLLVKGIDTWIVMLVFALIIVPFAEVAQGVVLNEKSLIIGGGCGLAGGIFTACCIAGKIALYADWYLPLFILAFVCMMIIPGHVLNRNAKRK